MVDTRKVALGLFGIYLVIMANVAIVDGDIVEVTLDPLVSQGDEVTTAQQDTNIEIEYSDNSNATPNAGPIEVETFTTGQSECVCNCKADGSDRLTAEQCAKLMQGEAKTEDIQMTNGESSTVQTATTKSPPICLTPGAQADPLDCRAYHDCTSVGSADGNYYSVRKVCQGKEAFSTEFGRCSRDISSCQNNVVCLIKGGIADPFSNNSYYWCEPRLIGAGFRIFHVDCTAIERFYPELGKCFIDINNLPQPPYTSYPTYSWNQLKDVDVVKAEIKLIKETEKLKLKTEKERIKAEQKLMKEMAKQESATFVCPQAGNFPSQVSDTIFFMCVPKKGTFKAELMKCPIGATFSVATGACVVGTPPNTSPNSLPSVGQRTI